MISDWKRAGWPIVRIREIGRLHGGGTPSRKRHEFFQGTIPWITGRDIPESHVAVISAARDYVSEEAVQESATRVVPAGAVLLTTRVSVGKTAVAGCPICFSQDITAILIHSAAIAMPAYVAYYLRARRAALLQKNQGSTIAGITRDSLALEQIPLPPLSEQKRIVEILQEAEEIRRLRVEAEARIADLIPAMFHRRFVSGRKYGSQPLFRLASITSGVTIGRKVKEMTAEVPYIRVANVQDGFVDLSEIKTTPATDEEIKRFSLKSGDVLLTEGGDLDKLGRGCLWEGQVDPCIHQNHVFRVRPISGKLNSNFFAQFLQSSTARQYFLRCAKRTTNLASINLTQLQALPVPDVPIEQQDRFAVEIRMASDCNVPRGNLTASALTRSLSTHAFSGQLTANWRKANQERLALEARQRDAALREAGPIFILSGRGTFEETPRLIELPTDGIYSNLNREQRILLANIHQNFAHTNQPRYFSAQSLSSTLEGTLRRNHQVIDGHLAVLAARGLLVPVSREEQTGDTGGYVFGNAYRLPLQGYEPRLDDENESRVGDHTRLRELERLAARLEKGTALP